MASSYPEDLPLLALMLLVRRSRSIGVQDSELRRIFGDRLPFLITELEEKLKPLGLVLRHDPEDKIWYVTIAPEYSDFVPGYLLSKTHAAVLATVILLKTKSGTVRINDVADFLEGKVARDYVINCLGFLKKEGYIRIRGDTIELGKRTKYEIDIDKFMENIFSVFESPEEASEKEVSEKERTEQ